MSSIDHITPRSALRHRPIGSEVPASAPRIKRASRTLARPEKLQMSNQTRQQHRWIQKLWELALSFCIGLAWIFVLCGRSVIDWFITLCNNCIYGTPRTFQTDTYVGHEGINGMKSHFIALNNQGRVEIIEFPGNDATRAQIYLGPVLRGPNADLVPVTLKFVPDPAGNMNMLVQVQGTSMLFINRNGTFQSAIGENNNASSENVVGINRNGTLQSAIGQNIVAIQR